MYPLDTFRAQGEDRVTGLRVARWNFTSLLVGLTLKRELHNQTRQLQEDVDEGLYYSSTGVHPILNEDSADVDLLGHVYAQPDFLLNGNMTTKNR